MEHKDDIYYYPDCETMTDIAYYYIDELQALGDIPPSLQTVSYTHLDVYKRQRLEDKLESGLYCELTDKTLHDGYIEYTLLYDMIANRITIDEVRAENGCLRLMKNLVWEYDALPHALIAGGTGGGKTYFLLTLIEALLHTDAILYILDPKNADLADLGTVMGNVYHTKEEMIDCVNAFYEGMVQRSEEMKRHPNYKTGENYAYLGLPPCFLIFDEYVAFFEMLGTKESVSLLSPVSYTHLDVYKRQHECRPDKRRCLIYRICKTVHRQPQRNKQKSRLPFKTACSLAEIKRTSGLAM